MVAGVFSVVVSFVSDSNIHKASIIVILMRNYSTDVKFKAWGVSLLSSHDTKLSRLHSLWGWPSHWRFWFISWFHEEHRSIFQDIRHSDESNHRASHKHLIHI
jgi:hypothetical protein